MVRNEIKFLPVDLSRTQSVEKIKMSKWTHYLDIFPRTPTYLSQITILLYG